MVQSSSRREIMGNLPSHSKRALSTYSQTGQRTVNIKENKRKYTKGNTLLQASLTYVKLKKKNTDKSIITIH